MERCGVLVIEHYRDVELVVPQAVESDGLQRAGRRLRTPRDGWSAGLFSLGTYSNLYVMSVASDSALTWRSTLRNATAELHPLAAEATMTLASTSTTIR